LPIGRESILGGNEYNILLVVLLFATLLTGTPYAFDQKNFTNNLIGYSIWTLGFGAFGFIVFSETFIKGTKFSSINLNIQKKFDEKPWHIMSMIFSKEEILDDKEISRLQGHIRENEKYIPYLLAQALKEAQIEKPRHYYYKVLCHTGNYIGEMDLILPARWETVWGRDHSYQSIVIGIFVRFISHIWVGGGNLRGYRTWLDNPELSKLQRFLETLHLKKYRRTEKHAAPIIYLTDSPLHRNFPELAIAMPQIITKELEIAKATQTLASSAIPYKAQVRELEMTVDAQDELREKQLDRDYRAPAQMRVGDVGAKKHLQLGGAKLILAMLAIVAIGVFAYSYYNGDVTFGDPTTVQYRVVPQQIASQYTASGWQVVGYTPDGNAIVKINTASIQSTQRQAVPAQANQP